MEFLLLVIIHKESDLESDVVQMLCDDVCL
jgi:hypothetical protein